MGCCTPLGQACSDGCPSPCSHYVVSNCFCNLSYQQIFWHLCVLKSLTPLYISYSAQDLHRDPPVQIHMPLCVGVQVETSVRLCKPPCYRRYRIQLHRVQDVLGWGEKALKFVLQQGTMSLGALHAAALVTNTFDLGFGYRADGSGSCVASWSLFCRVGISSLKWPVWV